MNKLTNDRPHYNLLMFSEDFRDVVGVSVCVSTLDVHR